MLRASFVSCVLVSLVGVVAVAAEVSPPVPAPNTSLLDMVDQLDTLDQQDLSRALEQADQCTRERDFDCSNAQIEKASKFANGAKDQLALETSRQKISREKTVIAEEERRRLEEERRREQEQLREEERLAQAERQRDSGFQWGKALALVGGAAIGGIDQLDAETQARILSGIVRDSQEGETGISNTQAGIDSANVSASAGSSTSESTSASTASCLRPGEIGDAGNVPPACSKGRQNTFGWGDTRDDACRGAQNGLRDEFGGGANATGCYCKADAKVNSVTQPYVCWIMFD